MSPRNKDDDTEGTDWERYAAELEDAFDGSDWPISPAPAPIRPERPRDWVQPDVDDERPEAADEVLDATYRAMEGTPRSTLERALLAIAGIGLVLIVLSEISFISLSPTLFIVVVIATVGAAVAWVVSYATGKEDDDGMRI
ncbi:hypothetical protein [Flaviflexus massiliensis]|uniref:hypothetical protein n=1 Tax=Flaviflexus massiliensis TaxID=1522309 RepID=UPI0006D599E1|nr:hypothetical protein [Flaviflexus massiliensis]